jgi:hypothetical protein
MQRSVSTELTLTKSITRKGLPVENKVPSELKKEVRNEIKIAKVLHAPLHTLQGAPSQGDLARNIYLQNYDWTVEMRTTKVL